MSLGKERGRRVLSSRCWSNLASIAFPALPRLPGGKDNKIPLYTCILFRYYFEVHYSLYIQVSYRKCHSTTFQGYKTTTGKFQALTQTLLLLCTRVPDCLTANLLPSCPDPNRNPCQVAPREIRKISPRLGEKWVTGEKPPSKQKKCIYLYKYTADTWNC